MKNWKDSRKLIDVCCFGCGINFNKTKSEYNRSEKLNKNHYCSINCRTNSLKIISDNKFGFCKNCGIRITGDNRSIFCSHSCNAIYNNKNRKGEKRNFSENGLENIRNASRNRLNIQIDYSDYFDNPSLCKECNKPLIFRKRKTVFCNINCKRMYDRKHLTDYQKYYKACQFKFGLSDYPNEFDFTLIEKYGWYKAKNHGDNLNGISRDHMISVKFGYENNISPDIINHPANCRLLRHSENSKKNIKCSITLNELQIKINSWNNKYI